MKHIRRFWSFYRTSRDIFDDSVGFAIWIAFAHVRLYRDLDKKGWFDE